MKPNTPFDLVANAGLMPRDIAQDNGSDGGGKGPQPPPPPPPPPTRLILSLGRTPAVIGFRTGV